MPVTKMSIAARGLLEKAQKAEDDGRIQQAIMHYERLLGSRIDRSIKDHTALRIKELKDRLKNEKRTI